MLRNFLLPVVIVLFSAMPVEAAGPPEMAGRVDFVTGDTRFIDASQQMHRPVRGDPLRATDTIVTGSDGEVHLDMEDGGYIAVRSNTRLKVKEYRAQGDKDDRVILNLLKGTFRSFTGWIPVVATKGYRTDTITATIGVRGTDHEPLFIPEGSDLGEPGTYDKVNEGATFIENASGRIEVLPNTAGFAPLAAGAKARLLEFVPDFFRPSPNENLLAGRHKLVQERLQERLDARRRLNKPRLQEDEPKTGPSSEMQEVPAEPNGTPGIQDTPASSTVPSIPAAPASAIVPSIPAAPASAVVPKIPPAPASAAVPGIPATPASAVVPGIPATPASAVVPKIPAAPASAAVPGIPVAPASAVVPKIPVAPASVIVPSILLAPASKVAPSVPAASPSAVVPSVPVASPSAVVPSNTVAPPPAVVPSDPEKRRSAAGRPRGVPEGDRSAVERARPEAAQPPAKDRAKLYDERRKKQQEDHQDQYERDRELEHERDTGGAAVKRNKEQR